MSKHSKKRTQASSPVAHYAGCLPSRKDESTSLTIFFVPGGNFDQALAQAISLLHCLSVHETPLAKGIEAKDVNDNDIDGFAGDFLPPNNNEGEHKSGNKAHSMIPPFFHLPYSAQLRQQRRQLLSSVYSPLPSFLTCTCPQDIKFCSGKQQCNHDHG